MKRRYAILEVPKSYRSSSGWARPEKQWGISDLNIHEAELSSSELRDIDRDPNVKDYGLIMPVRMIRPTARSIERGSEASESWGIAAVGASESPLDGSGVNVAVLDTGIDRSHPAFNDVQIVEEDFSGTGNGDADGHGTHCAGTIFGRDVDGVRIGIARNVNKALIGKIFSDNGESDSLAIFKSMRWATDHGAHIISMSIGFDFPGLVAKLVEDDYPIKLATSIALEHFKDSLRMFDTIMGSIEATGPSARGPLVIAAAGNDSMRDQDPRFRLSASLPSSASGVISVAALRKAAGGLEIAEFSNGRAVICAPGGDILSAARDGGLATMSGTSMACPHVAGVASLWWQKVGSSHIRANRESIKARLLTSAEIGLLAAFDTEDSEVGLVKSPA
ncbi:MULTISPECIES: S8 family serine peptidase [unclassified Neorhizobium]|uniref:S8 family peptidase n=1 Tax=unclassified Neorhizobium TaxID=2629175 RepID=UPI001FF55EE3|nr:MULTISPECIES: S8 family serine peptidase [unclassified Neorhizobium]MCJ9669452.1 S8 family serine peptidase [Neorhizobium sp. SHOUNA12B]MCJ9745523.1 S8 family serine peptidase [Neorhizobium sp. SHOUNA12A]